MSKVRPSYVIVAAEVVHARLASQLLIGPPASSVEDAVGRILAVQAQDPRGARLAVRARSSGLTAAGVDRAFSVDRSVVITWFNRGTLHLVRAEDYFWLHALVAPGLTAWNARRLRELEVSPDQAERAVDLIVRSIERDGPRTRGEITATLKEAGLPAVGQQIPHQVALASYRGLIVRGPMRDREQCYVLVPEWLGEAPAFDRDRALAELARRYLAGHGPASTDDLAYWTGLSITEAKAAFHAIAPELVERPDGLVELRSGARVRKRAVAAEPDGEAEAEFPPLPAGRLLGPFDPLLHGWRSRAAVLGPHQSLVTMNGMFKASILVGTRAVGTWTMPNGRVLLDPFEPLPPETEAALASEIRDVERFMARD